MKARQILEALLEGKKVGFDDWLYWYLNINGDLMASQDVWDFGGVFGQLFDASREVKVLAEDGP